MSEISPLSFFASKSISGHLLRGAAAVAFFTVAIKASATMPALSVSAGIVAIVMLRGCPMCWTVGLIETVFRRLKRE